jgi:hypothetical protein
MTVYGLYRAEYACEELISLHFTQAEAMAAKQGDVYMYVRELPILSRTIPQLGSARSPE